jgi:hypothetical protein
MFKTCTERRKAIAAVADLLTGRDVDLPAVASFIDDVYCLGCYSDPKAYTAAAKKHVAALDKATLRLVQDGVWLRDRQQHLAAVLFAVGKVRADIEGHEYRARRIIEDMDARGEAYA